MARPLRIEFKDAYYHVTNRGFKDRDVFKAEWQYKLFLEKLFEFAKSILTDRFHLFLKTKEPNLSQFIKNFLVSFSMIMNKRLGKSGNIFHGRFKSHVVENKYFKSSISRFIHLAPVRIDKYKNKSVAEKRKLLREYKWSSYLYYIGTEKKLPGLNIQSVLSEWGKNQTDKIQNYRRFVEHGLQNDIDNPFDFVSKQVILGSKSFVNKISNKYLLPKK